MKEATLAEISGKDTSYISKLENGKLRISFEKLKELLETIATKVFKQESLVNEWLLESGHVDRPVPDSSGVSETSTTPKSEPELTAELERLLKDLSSPKINEADSRKLVEDLC